MCMHVPFNAHITFTGILAWDSWETAAGNVRKVADRNKVHLLLLDHSSIINHGVLVRFALRRSSGYEITISNLTKSRFLYRAVVLARLC